MASYSLKGRGFSKTEKQMVDILKDGQWHHRSELLNCMGISRQTGLPTTLNSLHPRITSIRSKLPRGMAILCVYSHRRIGYQMVRKIVPANDGKN